MTSEIFDIVAEYVEEHTYLDRFPARGALRIALKKSGLNVRRVKIEQLVVVLLKVMPDELCQMGVDDAEKICRGAIERLTCVDLPTEDTATSDEILSYIGGD